MGPEELASREEAQLRYRALVKWFRPSLTSYFRFRKNDARRRLLTWGPASSPASYVPGICVAMMSSRCKAASTGSRKTARPASVSTTT